MSPSDIDVERAARAIVNNVHDEVIDIDSLGLEIDPGFMSDVVEAKRKERVPSLLYTSVIASGERKDEVSWNFVTVAMLAPEWTDPSFPQVGDGMPKDQR